jgi:hypothetical protein
VRKLFSPSDGHIVWPRATPHGIPFNTSCIAVELLHSPQPMRRPGQISDRGEGLQGAVRKWGART